MPHKTEEITLRRLESLEDYGVCVAMQKTTWGADFTEVVPAAILKVSQRIGGVTAGAFSACGEMLGFVFGMTGVENGRLVHWSDMLAVRPEAQGRDLGFRLKCYQRELLLPLGVETVYWTFDPLVARNAWFNITKLGAGIAEYVENMYGETDSPLHAGLGTDRLVVAWQIQDAAVAERMAGASTRVVNSADYAPMVNVRQRGDQVQPAGDTPLPDAPQVRIAVPRDIHALQQTVPAAGQPWRASTRRAFQHYFAHGYRVNTFDRVQAAYVLARTVDPVR